MCCLITSICAYLLSSLILISDVTECQSLAKTTDYPKQLQDYSTNHTQGSGIDVKTVNQRPRTKAPPKHAKFVLMPPFLIGACSVLVLYALFHCIYMHCYTEKKVRTIASRTAAKTPTIIINEDISGSSVQKFTPLVKYEASGGKTEIVEAQPFLICQPLDEEVGYSHSEKRKSIQLQIPKFMNKLRRGSRASSIFSGESSIDPDSPREESPLNVDRNMRTRASICFVPVGQSVTDPQSNGTEWTPLHGFVYSSFVLPRRPSYKQACKSNESVSRMSSSSDKTIDEPVMVFPSKASFYRSVSQPAENPSETLDDMGLKANGTARKSSRVSFHLSENSKE